MGSKQNTPQDDHQFLISQLQDALETTKKLSVALDNECKQNVEVRVILTKDIEYLGETVDRIEKILLGGSKSIIERLIAVEGSIDRHVQAHKILDKARGQNETRRGNDISLWIGIIATIISLIAVAVTLSQ